MVLSVKAKVSLINVRHSDSNVMPEGLLSIAGYIEASGHSAQVFDPFFGNETFINKLREFNPDIIGYSILTSTYKRGIDLHKKIKSMCGDAFFCAGNVHPTALPEPVLAEMGIDAVIIGEGEKPFLHICNTLDQIRKDRDSLRTIRSVALISHGNLYINHELDLIQNLDELPFTPYDKLVVEKYLIPPGYIRSHYYPRTLVVYTGRGCPYSCVFCASHMISGRGYRRHSVSYMIEFLKLLKDRHRLEAFYFFDDTFTIDAVWLNEFLNRYKSEINLPWGAQGRVDLIDEKVLRLFAGTGCVQIDYGVESGSDRVLSALGKKITTDDIRRAFRLTRQYKIRPYASIMVGNPEERWEDILKTSELLREIKPAYTSVCFIQPLPGSGLYNLSIKHGWFRSDICQEYSDWDFRKSAEPIIAIDMTAKEIIKARALLQNQQFLRNYFGFISLSTSRFILYLLCNLISSPALIWKALRQFWKTGKFDDCIDFALLATRYRIMKRRVRAIEDL